VASKNLRPNHPIPITTQFTLPDRAGELRKCPRTWSLCFGVFSQGQPGLLGMAECRLSRGELGAQSIHLHMVVAAGQCLGDFVSLSLQFDHVLLRLAEESVCGHRFTPARARARSSRN